MNDEEEFKPLKLETFIEGIRGLPDGYDDPRIDNIVNIITCIVEDTKALGWIDVDRIRDIVADSTEFPEMWEYGYEL